MTTSSLFTSPSTIMILDGGMGDFLQHGLGATYDNETTWSASLLQDPTQHELIVKAHQMFIQAGAKAITTCNFSVRRHIGFTDKEITRLIGIATNLATCAVQQCDMDDKITILASLPPLLDCYRGTTVSDEEDGITQYVTMITAFESCNNPPQGYLAETLNCLKEATYVMEAYRRCGIRNKPLLLSMCVNEEGKLYSGERFDHVITQILANELAPQVNIQCISLNCSTSHAIDLALENVTASVHALLAAAHCRLGAYPNRYQAVSSSWTTLQQSHVTDFGPDEFAKTCLKWIRMKGVRMIGGCCGIGPADIREFVKQLNSC